MEEARILRKTVRDPRAQGKIEQTETAEEGAEVRAFTAFTAFTLKLFAGLGEGMPFTVAIASPVFGGLRT